MIIVSCQCGKKYRVKDEYAGRNVRCPNCNAQLQVPSVQAGEQQSTPPLQLDLLEGLTGGDEQSFDSYLRCPQCGQVLPLGQPVCTSCGYDLRTGHKTGINLKRYLTPQVLVLAAMVVIVLTVAIIITATSGPKRPKPSRHAPIVETTTQQPPTEPTTAEPTEDPLQTNIDNLTSPEEKTRAQAIKALVKMGSTAAPAVVQLLEDPRRREAADEILTRMGPAAVEPLVQAMRNPTLAPLAERILTSIGPSGVPELAKLLKSAPAPEKLQAALLLAKIDPTDRRPLPVLREALKNADPKTKLQAALAIIAIKPESPETVPVLCEALSGSKLQRQLQIIRALKLIGPVAYQAIPQLTELACSDDTALAPEAIKTLAAIRRDDIAALVRELRNGQPRQRQLAATLLGWIGSSAASATPNLIKILTQNDSPASLKNEATLAVMRIGPAAAPYLAEALANDDERIRQAACAVMARMGPDAVAAADALADALKDADLRALAAETLPRLGPQAADAVVKVMRYKLPEVRILCCRVLGRIGSHKPDIIRALLISTEDANNDVRAAAISALGELGDNSEQVQRVVIAALGHRKQKVRQAAVDAAARLGKALVEKLITSLKHGNNNARIAAAEALGRIGPSAREALPALKRCAASGNEALKNAAAQAIARITNPAPK